MKIEESTLDSIRSRPRFKIHTDISPGEYTSYLRTFLDEHSAEFIGIINSESATITVKTSDNNYWKPNLALRAEYEPGENSTVVRGIFGPSSAVWTFFMFLYFVLGILWMVFITIWFVELQISSNDFPWALMASFIMVFLLALTYLAALLGQRKARDEMQKLRTFAEKSVLKFEESRIN